MITFAWYLLKVIICSGILCGYYYLALRNKIFNSWNRFYLLSSVILALSVPLIKINIFHRTAEDKGTVIRVLQTINNSDEIIIEYSRHSGLQFTTENMIIAGYLFITLVFLAIFFLSIFKIYHLQKKYPVIKMKEVNFIATDAKGTPFSFFKSIFWNNAIDLHSRHGQQIFNHEIAHVKEKHSYDKMFMNLVLLFFWMNPFFWLIRKELYMIHEFIADKEALEDNDLNAFAEMVLQTVYPNHHFTITNNFSHSPLKRRLMMFSKNKNPKVSYLSRLLVLPLAAIIFLAFTIKMKTISKINFYSGKKITVVIDAGHGGSDNGAMANNINEKDLNLAIAKDVLALNTNQNLNVVLSRSSDEELSPKERVKFAEDHKADLFISIHTDAEENKNTHSGLTVFITKDENGFLKESTILGTSLIEAFRNNYPLQIPDNLVQREKGIWVLKATQCPSVLLETGFLTTQKDFDYLLNPDNQKKIAQNILNGIEKYAEQNLSGNSGTFSNPKDTVPATLLKAHEMINKDSDVLYIIDGKISNRNEASAFNPNDIESITILKDESAIKQYGEKAKNGVIIYKKKPKAISNARTENTVKPDPIYFLDGKEISKDKMNTISPNAIQSIEVLSVENAIAVYGQKAKNGVILITSKSENLNTSITLGSKTNTDANSIRLTNQNDKSGNMNNNIDFNGQSKINITTDTIPDKVFTKVEIEAQFPGGPSAWTKYIISKIQDSIKTFTDKDYGTCFVRFIVNTDGRVSHVEATTMKDTHLAKITIEAVKTGPNWIPATQNGNVVAAYRLQPVTLTNPDNK